MDPTHSQKISVVLRTVRTEIAPAIRAGVGLDAETLARVDRMLLAAQRELGSSRLPAQAEEPVHPRFKI